MKRRLMIFSSIFFALLFGCSLPAQTVAPATTSPSAAAVATALTATPAPASLAPAPSAPPVVSSQPLRTRGPYLAYQDQQADHFVLKLLDADGLGQTTIDYPANFDSSANNLPLSNSLSPDGKWLAFYTGSAGTAFGVAGPASNDLALNLMNLADGTVRELSALLSKDYPDIFSKAAQQIGLPDITADSLRNAFIVGITNSLDWSPDGRYLAFAGQMDGLSSDLYLYDSVFGNIKRYSSGPEEVLWISWSPDGKWILDGSGYSVGEGMQNSIYATSVDGAVINLLSNGKQQVITPADWLDDHEYFDSNGANGPGAYDLKLVDLNSGVTAQLWPGSYSPYAFVPYGNWVVLDANTPVWPYPYNSNDFQTGLFLVNTTTQQQIRVNSLGPWGCCSSPQFFALGHISEHLFLVKDPSTREIQYLSATAKLTSAGIQADRISVSPDRLVWIAISTSLQVFSDDGSLLRTLDLPTGLDPKSIRSIIWRQNSSGLFFTSPDPRDPNSTLQLYALDLSNGTPLLVGSLRAAVPDNYFWIAGSK
jgi:hypothetical protein